MNRPFPSGIANVFPMWDAFDSVDHGHNGVKVVNQRKQKWVAKMQIQDILARWYQITRIVFHPKKKKNNNIRMSVYQKKFATRHESK